MNNCKPLKTLVKARVYASPLPSERMYVLTSPYVLGDYIIPKGYRWDGASIPRVFWSIIGSPFSPEFMRASLVHDFLYHKNEVTAKCTDNTFLKILLQDGVSSFRAKTMYAAVRAYRIGV